MREHVLSCTRMAGAKVKVVPLGTDLQRFDPCISKCRRPGFLLDYRTIRKSSGCSDDSTPARDRRYSSVPSRDVAKHNPGVLLVIAGDETAGEPGYKRYLEEISREIGVDRHVQFLPFTDDVPRLMSALDIFILPSFAETYGLVVIEAMAMEKPIIATNAGGVPEILTDGKTGLLVEPRNAEAIANAIIKILDDEKLPTTLGRAAREDALRRFSMDRCVDALLGLLTVI